VKRKAKDALYALIPYVKQGEVCKEASAQVVIKGKLENHLICSVPESTSGATVNELSKELERKFKKPVIVITHNMEFVKAKRLTGKEAQQVLREIVHANSAHPSPQEEEMG